MVNGHLQAPQHYISFSFKGAVVSSLGTITTGCTKVMQIWKTIAVKHSTEWEWEEICS